MCNSADNKNIKKGIKNPNRYRFSWLELVTDTLSGQTSASGFCGILLVLVPLFLFVVTVIFYFFHIDKASDLFTLIDKFTVWVGIGSGLLGLRKFSTMIGGRKLDLEGVDNTPNDNDKPHRPTYHESYSHEILYSQNNPNTDTNADTNNPENQTDETADIQNSETSDNNQTVQ